MHYDRLDRQARYKVRVVYAGDSFRNPIRLDADGQEVHGWFKKPNPPVPVEFDVPAAGHGRRQPHPDLAAGAGQGRQRPGLPGGRGLVDPEVTHARAEVERRSMSSHEKSPSRPAPRGHEPSRALLHRPGPPPGRARAVLLRHVDPRRPGRPDPESRRLRPPRRRRRERDRHPADDGVDPGLLQRLPPSRHAALRGARGQLPRPDPLPLPRLGLRPQGGSSRPPRWTTCRTSARRITRCEPGASASGTATSS